MSNEGRPLQRLEEKKKKKKKWRENEEKVGMRKNIKKKLVWEKTQKKRR